jgi:Fe-S cluster assembly protein SufD
MNTVTHLPQRLDELAALPGRSPAHAALLRAALDAGLPTTRDENWKYANLRALDRQPFSPPEAIAGDSLEAARAALPERLDGFVRIVFVDGLHGAELSDDAPPPCATVLDATSLPARAAGGASVGGPPLSQPATPRAANRGVPVDLRLSQINAALATGGLAIAVPAGGHAAIEVVFVAATDAALAASHPVLHVELAEGATLDLVERHLGAGDTPTFTNAEVRIRVARGAQLHHHRLQQLGPRSRHFETLTLETGDGAACEFLTVASGAQSSRSTALLRLAGRESSLAWNAVSLADRTQVNDAYVQVEHLGQGARTSQVFRGIAAGRSRVAFNGHMVVRDSAAGAGSDQSLKALLAGAEAEADLRPQLEIYVDEVRASHGATVGKLDDQSLFYLLSRGIERVTAEALLKWAFVADVVARIRIPALRRQAEALLAAQLRAVIDVGDLR